MARLNEVFDLKAPAESLRLYNGTGAILYQGELSVLGRLPVVANEQVASAAVGSFDVAANKVLRSDDLKAAENTFGTNNQPVYFDPATGKLSDTATVGYYLIGQLVAGGTKSAAGNIEFTTYAVADLIESDET